MSELNMKRETQKSWKDRILEGEDMIRDKIKGVAKKEFDVFFEKVRNCKTEEELKIIVKPMFDEKTGYTEHLLKFQGVRMNRVETHKKRLKDNEKESVFFKKKNKKRRPKADEPLLCPVCCYNEFTAKVMKEIIYTCSVKQGFSEMYSLDQNEQEYETFCNQCESQVGYYNNEITVINEKPWKE